MKIEDPRASTRKTARIDPMTSRLWEIALASEVRSWKTPTSTSRCPIGSDSEPKRPRYSRPAIVVSPDRSVTGPVSVSVEASSCFPATTRASRPVRRFTPRA